jgi:hypothetical protein
MGFRSGDLAGIICIFALIDCKAFFALADVWHGQLSISKNIFLTLLFSPLVSKRLSKYLRINEAK